MNHKDDPMLDPSIAIDGMEHQRMQEEATDKTDELLKLIEVSEEIKDLSGSQPLYNQSHLGNNQNIG